MSSSPMDLAPGDHIEITYDGMVIGDMVVERIHVFAATGSAFAIGTLAGHGYWLPMDSKEYSWRRLGGNGAPTLPRLPVPGGATCTRCREHSPWAEPCEGFRCWSCRQRKYG